MTFAARAAELVERPDGKAPDGRAHETDPWPGGTWVGTCGATKWVDTPSSLDTVVHQHRTSNDHVRTLQAWWWNSRYGRREYFSSGPTPGYRIECNLPRQHQGEHGIELADGGPVMVVRGWSEYNEAAAVRRARAARG